MQNFVTETKVQNYIVSASKQAKTCCDKLVQIYVVKLGDEFSLSSICWVRLVQKRKYWRLLRTRWTSNEENINKQATKRENTEKKVGAKSSENLFFA